MIPFISFFYVSFLVLKPNHMFSRRTRSCMIVLAIMLLLSGTTMLYGQNKIRGPVWTFNTDSTTIHGISVGYMHTKKIQHVISNGVRIEALGLGVFLMLMPASPIAHNDSTYKAEISKPVAETINGINLSPLGHGCDCSINGIHIYGPGSIVTRSNGIAAGLYANFSNRHNGLQAALVWNHTYNFTGVQLAFLSNENVNQTTGLQVSAYNRTKQLRGVQIGIVNKTGKINGLQIGLLNINEKRKLPFINW
jgi:hypothetical protein